MVRSGVESGSSEILFIMSVSSWCEMGDICLGFGCSLVMPASVRDTMYSLEGSGNGEVRSDGGCRFSIVV